VQEAQSANGAAQDSPGQRPGKTMCEIKQALKGRPNRPCYQSRGSVGFVVSSSFTILLFNYTQSMSIRKNTRTEQRWRDTPTKLPTTPENRLHPLLPSK